jgi:signal peptide peptidase SppA
MFDLKHSLWLGDAASLEALLKLEDMAAKVAPGATPAPTMGVESLPRLYSRKGNIGVVTIRGGLINSDSPLAEMFGISTYPAIREAMVYAATDPKVSQILMDIDSPGGQVSGVNDVAKLVKRVDAIKPVTAFSESLVASAAYWIASGARELHVGDTAIVGSIGVIATHVDYSGALEKDGVKVSIIRAGKNKALGHPAEPLTKEARAQIQERADSIYDIFVGTVSANRESLASGDSDVWAEGNEFMGADAVDVGLADSVSSFDQVMQQIVDKAEVFHNNPQQRTRGMQMKPRAALDPKLVAAIESGAALTPEQEAALAAATAPEAASAEPVLPAAAPEAPAPEAADAQGHEPTANAAAPVSASSVEAKPDLVVYLEGAVKERDAQILSLNVELKSAMDSLASMQAAHDALVGIAKASINKMQVALGGHEMALTGLSATEIVAKHAQVNEDFKQTFKVEGVAVSAPEASKKAAEAANVSPIHAARIRAVNLKRG